METATVTVKPRIFINPPPRDFHCEKCGRKFEELPIFQIKIDMEDKNSLIRGSVVLDKERKPRLLKTFRGHQCISASWECVDCIRTPDHEDLIMEILSDFADPYSEEKTPLLKRKWSIMKLKWNEFIIRRLCKKAIRKEKLQFEWDGLLMPTNYWSRALSIRTKEDLCRAT